MLEIPQGPNMSKGRTVLRKVYIIICKKLDIILNIRVIKSDKNLKISFDFSKIIIMKNLQNLYQLHKLLPIFKVKILNIYSMIVYRDSETILQRKPINIIIY